MSRTTRVLLTIVAGLVLAPTFAQDAPAPAELVTAAIATHGGESAIRDYLDLERSGTMELFGGRMAGRRAEVLTRERADGAYRTETTLEFRGRKFTPIEFYDGEVRKRRMFRGWDDLPVDESRENASHRLGFLLDIDPAEAEAVGPATEADVAVWQISVPDGRDRAVLSFDQESGRLVAMEYPGTSAAGMGTKEEVRRKLVFRDYREVGGLMLPFDIETFEDGSPTARLRYESIERLQAFDPAWLRIPDPTRRFIPSEELAF